MKALGREVYPYLIRHGRLTQVQGKLSSKTYEDFAGHSLEVASRYHHPSQGKLLQDIKKGIYDIKELSKEQKQEFEARIKKLEEEHKNFKANMKKDVDAALKILVAQMNKKGIKIPEE